MIRRAIPALRAWEQTLPKDSFVPSVLFVDKGLSVFMILMSALIMSKIEKKTLRDYGLPLREAFGKRFWQGSLFGLGMLSVLMGLLGALHGFTFDGFALGCMGRSMRLGLFSLVCSKNFLSGVPTSDVGIFDFVLAHGDCAVAVVWRD